MDEATLDPAALYAFKKKSDTRRETPRRDIELIKQRLREAEQIAMSKKGYEVAAAMCSRCG